MKKLFFVGVVLLSILFTACNITNKMGSGDTPFSTTPTHIEFYNGGAKIAEYDNAVVRVSSVYNSRFVGADITWYYYEIVVNGVVVETIIDSEALAIKYTGRRSY